MPAAPPPAVLAAWKLTGAAASPLGEGLINQTWLVTRGPERFVLQAVNRVFPPAINADIQVVTAHLRRAGLLTPVLVPLPAGALWFSHAGDTWRLLTWVAGVSHRALASPAQAASAGALLARFHGALLDLRHDFSNPRLGVHDTARHLATLGTALTSHRDHPAYGAVAPLAADILGLAADLPALPATPDRIVHGDPKINNVLFDPASGEALCLVDLDTLAPMPLPLELGDAFRSWCNPAGEDRRDGDFALALFQAALKGYAAGAAGFITPAERDAIVPATLTIYVELAARFCADALNERYFGWDPARYPSRSVHNQVRAASQLAAARSLWSLRPAAEEAVRRAFAA